MHCSWVLIRISSIIAWISSTAKKWSYGPSKQKFLQLHFIHSQICWYSTRAQHHLCYFPLGLWSIWKLMLLFRLVKNEIWRLQIFKCFSEVNNIHHVGELIRQSAVRRRQIEAKTIRSYHFKFGLFENTS